MDPVDVTGGFARGQSMTMLVRALAWRGDATQKLVLIGAAVGMTTDAEVISEFAQTTPVFVEHALDGLRQSGALVG